jgi:hypothetical protein
LDDQKETKNHFLFSWKKEAKNKGEILWKTFFKKIVFQTFQKNFLIYKGVCNL